MARFAATIETMGRAALIVAVGSGAWLAAAPATAPAAAQTIRQVPTDQGEVTIDPDIDTGGIDRSGETDTGITTEGETDEGITTEGETDEGITAEGETDEGITAEGETDEGETSEGILVPPQMVEPDSPVLVAPLPDGSPPSFPAPDGAPAASAPPAGEAPAAVIPQQQTTEVELGTGSPPITVHRPSSAVIQPEAPAAVPNETNANPGDADVQPQVVPTN
jgi:hypothetical protein